MPEPAPLTRPLGTMIAYGFPRGDLNVEFDLVERLGAECLEILPDWKQWPDPTELGCRVRDRGLRVHSVHGCWGGQSIAARRVDLGDPESAARRESLDDIRRCADWTHAAGGSCLVVHPGGLSDPVDREARRGSLASSLLELDLYVAGSGVTVCVENMPPGVHPGSEMTDLAALVAELDRARVRLAIDTGHAHITGTPADATRAAGSFLATTHVHDNNGRQDTHLPPGHGSIDWPAWRAALDAIGYSGPVMLECIRHLRRHPECIDGTLLDGLALLCCGAVGSDHGR